MQPAEQVVQAVKTGEIDTLRTLVRDDPRLASARDENGISAVMLAAYYRQAEALSVLLAANPALDLFEAAALGKRERAAELIGDDPASVAAHSPDGFTPLHLACFFGHSHNAELLIQRAADVNAVARNSMAVAPLHSAAAGRHLDVVRLLLERGAEVNATQQGGFTALHAAAMQGDEAMVSTLLDAGADAHIETEGGQTAADMAREKGHESVAALLR